jgi:Flp pilus assembly protein TadG
MVEFALVGPIAFLVLIGTVVLGIIVLHDIQLTQAVRDGARAAAICGSQTGVAGTSASLPDSNLQCTGANIVGYINARVKRVDPGLSNQAMVTVYCDGSVLGCANGSVPLPATALPAHREQRLRHLRRKHENHLGQGRGDVRAMRVPRGHRAGRGQSLVEFALIAPLLIVLLVGGAQFAAILYSGITVASAAHDAAKVASEQPAGSKAFALGGGGAAGAGATCPGGSINPVCQAVAQSKGLLGTVTTTVAPSTADTSPACSTNPTWVPDGYVTVTVSNDVPIFVPFLNNLIANSTPPGSTVRTISTTVVMRVEPCSMTAGK